MGARKEAECFLNKSPDSQSGPITEIRTATRDRVLSHKKVPTRNRYFSRENRGKKWCPVRDSNPHARALGSKPNVSTNSTNWALKVDGQNGIS